MSYGIIVTSREMRCNTPERTIMTEHGTKLWIILEPQYDWISSEIVSDPEKPSLLLKTWDTMLEAESFAKKWKGHPWWCSPIAYDVIEVEPRIVPRQEGWIVRRSQQENGG